MAVPCVHLTTVQADPMPDEGCGDCLAVGDTWLHLRYCVTCGYIGCCDSSKNRHARQHAHTIHHPVVRSKEPGESWAYCFDDDITVKINPS